MNSFKKDGLPYEVSERLVRRSSKSVGGSETRSMVGMARLELTTPRSQNECATNCATSRHFDNRFQDMHASTVYVFFGFGKVVFCGAASPPTCLPPTLYELRRTCTNVRLLRHVGRSFMRRPTDTTP
jgi:hypothetical protein